MPETSNALPKDHRDLQGKDIFHDPILCAQFLRDNVKHPIIKKIQPEDIEDHTERFRPYFGREFESDVVKCICVKDNNEEYLFYLISLIEHKSTVEYNVAMQLLKYMVCIWTEYEKTFGKDYKDKVRNKEFRYPPILPIVYYEGSDTWTASRELKHRIQFADVFEEHIPNFTYELVDIHQISNQELLERKDVMSIIMLLNKIQTSKELAEFNELPKDNVENLMQEVPEQVVDILVSVIRTLCKRINATVAETDECVARVRTKNMGYLFENMEPMDIQAERKRTAEAREERIKAEAERDKVVEERNKVVEERNKVVEERNKVVEERNKVVEERNKIVEDLKTATEEIKNLRQLLKKHNIAH